jgi:hypothetical protein
MRGSHGDRKALTKRKVLRGFDRAPYVFAPNKTG